MTFKKGESGNPEGRKKENGELRALARTFTAEVIQKLVYWLRSDDPRASVAAANILLDRGHGKPSQELELSGKVTVVPALRIKTDAGA